MRQPGFFDIDERYAALNAMGDPLGGAQQQHTVGELSEDLLEGS
ncbi:MAG: hypothetical protein ACRED0_10830 [Gammaproteobacteria bacterium]